MEYKSNVRSVLLNLENKLKKASDVSALQRNVGAYLYSSNLRRIHNDGLDVYLKSIGSYSVKPIYVNPLNSPKAFEPKGKNGRVYFKTWHGFKVQGKMHKTRYFAAGYFGFRATINRDITRVNLQLTGRLKLDWALAQQGKNWVLGFQSAYGSNVSLGNEEHFGTLIWGVTVKDREEIKKIEDEFIKKALA